MNVVECGAGTGKINFKRNVFISSQEELNIFRRQHDNINIYATALSYDSVSQREALKYGPLYMDFDNLEDFEQVRVDALRVAAYLKTVLQVPYSDMRFYFSGYKGLHLLLPPGIFSLQPRVDLNQVYGRVVVDIAQILWPPKTGEQQTILQHTHTLDLQIYDIRRLFRLPNSINGKTGLYKIPLLIDEVRHCERDSILKRARGPRLVKHLAVRSNTAATMYLESYNTSMLERSSTIEERRISILPSCAQWILANPLPEGSRNLACMIVASSLHQTGLDKSQIKERLLEWGSRCQPPLEQGIITSIVERVQYYKYGCNSVKALAPCDAKCPYYKTGKSFSRW